MKKTTLISCTLVLFFNFIANSQLAHLSVSNELAAQQPYGKDVNSNADRRINLRVGDRVDNIEFTMLDNGEGKSHLYDFSEELIILDFWSTWCGTCIAKFPTLDSLSTTFSGKLKFILVNCKRTRDTKEDIEALFEKRKNKNGEAFKFPVAILDTIAFQRFLHVGLPHYVWIKNGEVIAITSAKYITKENIQEALDNNNFRLPEKDDLKKYGLTEASFEIKD
jgi:thiol-disulfide isomerase/thioredoxin